MFLVVAIIAGLFIWAIIYNSNKSKRTFQSQPKQGLKPRRVTVDSLRISREDSIKKLQNTVEGAFRNHIKRCIADTPAQLKHSATSNTLIMDSLANFAQSLINNLCQKPEINRVYTSNEIESIVSRAEKRVIGEFLPYI